MEVTTLAHSPFQQWLGVSYIPPDLDTAHLKEFLAQPTAQVAALDREVESLERALQDRLAQRLLLNESVEKHKSLRHPIRYLPKEILQEIFTFCLPRPHIPVMDQQAAPLTLTRVSRDWRNVALDTPRLWQDLHIVVKAGTRQFLEFHMAVANRWLAAAKNQPLSISIWCKEAPAEDTFDIFVNSILSHSSHIRHLTLDVVPPLVHLFGGSLPPSSWPMLEKVSLKKREDSIGLGHMVHGLLIWNAPLLRRVEWASVDCDLWGAGLRWDTMEDILVYQRESGGRPAPQASFNPAKARAMVRCTPSIRNLRITLTEHHFPLNRGPMGPLELQKLLVLPHLTTLDLTDVHVSPDFAPVVFLKNLQLPALTTLKYELCTAREGDQQVNGLAPLPEYEEHPLVRFLRAQHSPVMICTFETDILSTSRQGLLECLKMMPLIECLGIGDRAYDARQVFAWTHHIGSIAADKALLDSLLPPDNRTGHDGGEGDPECLCPRLTTLWITRIKCDLEDVEALVDARLAFSKASKNSKHRLSSLAMGVTSTRITEGCSQKKRMRVEKALHARGVSAFFSFDAPSSTLASPFSLHTQKFDPYAGYEFEKYDEPSEHDWL